LYSLRHNNILQDFKGDSNPIFSYSHNLELLRRHKGVQAFFVRFFKTQSEKKLEDIQKLTTTFRQS